MRSLSTGCRVKILVVGLIIFMAVFCLMSTDALARIEARYLLRGRGHLL
jgi:hypothetical protein